MTNQTRIVLACTILHNFITVEDGVPLEVELEDDDGHASINVPILETYGMSQRDRDDWTKF